MIEPPGEVPRPPAPPPLTTLVVADAELRTATLEAALRDIPRVRVVTGDLAALPDLVDQYEPHVVVLATSPPRVNGALERLTDLPRIPAVIVLTSAPQEAWTAQARRAGVRAVLRPDVATEELAVAIAAIDAGLVLLHPDALRKSARARSAVPGASDTALTQRELEVLEMMAEGMNNRAIAAKLRISRHTVKFHVAAILAKLGARTRTEAVTLGVRHGLISL